MSSIRRCFECGSKDDCDKDEAAGIDTYDEVLKAEGLQVRELEKMSESWIGRQKKNIEEATGEDVKSLDIYLRYSGGWRYSFHTDSYRGYVGGDDLSDINFMPRDSICVCPISVGVGREIIRENLWYSSGADGEWRGSLEEAMFGYVNQMISEGFYKKAERVRSPDGYGTDDSSCEPVYKHDDRKEKPVLPSVKSEGKDWKYIKDE